eukprot:TRINITY_DN20531_c0_g1_i1.p2 TRINITY_DN20531_c0_g1~~TRINITY_DN20531_c0_g1_i1.p2  ORF type:complete len:336 (+),score=103.87 TRINITY_DN20531_c0_g1_i1:43-1050(+)
MSEGAAPDAGGTALPEPLPSDYETLRVLVRQQDTTLQARTKKLDEVVALADVVVTEREKMTQAGGDVARIQRQVVAAEEAVRMVEEVLVAWEQSRAVERQRTHESEQRSLIKIAELQRQVDDLTARATRQRGLERRCGSHAHPVSAQPATEEGDVVSDEVAQLKEQLRTERQRRLENEARMRRERAQLSRSLGSAEAEITLLQQQLADADGRHERQLASLRQQLEHEQHCRKAFEGHFPSASARSLEARELSNTLPLGSSVLGADSTSEDTPQKQRVQLEHLPIPFLTTSPDSGDPDDSGDERNRSVDNLRKATMPMSPRSERQFRQQWAKDHAA